MRRLVFYFFGFLIMASFAFGGGKVYEKEKIFDLGKIKEFSGQELKTIAFPIGGLGTGNITLGGRGEIRELEIFNKPDKGKSPEFTFFSIWAKEEGKKVAARMLERELIPPYVASEGIPRNQLPGVSRFKETRFRGEFPFAYLAFEDKAVPVSVELEAYNPFVPLSPEKSGIPAAIFNWKIKNHKDSIVNVSLAFSMLNPIKTANKSGQRGFGKNLNQYLEEGRFRGIKMSSNRADVESIDFGSIAFVTSEKDVDVQTRWYRGGWWDDAQMFWDDFADDGRLKVITEGSESGEGRSDVATLLVHIKLNPGEEKDIPFYLTWYFPNRENYWNREEEVRGKKFKNFYATKFKDAWEVCHYLLENEKELYQETKHFHDILFRSTYPFYVIDALSSQASSLKTNLVMRTEDGKFFGFEGLSDDSGCCPMNCTHVWNYEQALAFLFPCLERSVRETDFLHNTFPNGYQVFRTLIPLGDYWWTFKPCADGQMGNIVRVYREWKLCGDMEWLRKLWPKVKASLEFAWKGVGEVDEKFAWQRERLTLPWDPDKNGVMEAEQHNTYDIEFYGPNTMTGALYLAALKASAEMAEALGEKKNAKEYLALYEKGSKEYDRLLWNGEYYVQKVMVIEGLAVPEHLRSPEKDGDNPCCEGKESPGGKKEALGKGETIPKYQYGEGCLSDQLLGQYLAHVAGLGYILDKEHVDKAMQSIFKYNFFKDLSSFSNVQRVYALNEEAGLLLCSWPKGARPSLPFVYSDEVWTGIEYQVAASLIYSGLIEEGLTVVKAARDRYRGYNRNPWDELECGHHYARAMSSWALLIALSGFQYDGVSGFIAFSPRINRDNFFSFWSSGSGWGSFEVKGNELRLKVEEGSLKLSRLGISKEYGFKSAKIVLVNLKEVPAKLKFAEDLSVVEFDKPIELYRGGEAAVIFEK